MSFLTINTRSNIFIIRYTTLLETTLDFPYANLLGDCEENEKQLINSGK